jgi:hypothetical protein
MSDVVGQPKGAGTEHKEGTIYIGGPQGAGSDVLGSNNVINTYVSNLPTTGTIIDKYTNRFDDYNYYSA